MSADTTLPGYTIAWPADDLDAPRLSRLCRGRGGHRPPGRPPRASPGSLPVRGSVAAIVTVADEEPELFRECLDALLRQTRLPDGLIVVDDGSADPSCVRIAHQRAGWFQRRGVRYRVVAHQEPLGRREGLADGFREFYAADIYLCVGSGTVLRDDAVQRLIACFADPRVQAATGVAAPRNWDRNLLTRLTSLPSPPGLPTLRAAAAALGSVLCACGCLAAYRGPVLRRCMGDFVMQEFRGRPVAGGDHRRLTSYCLREGRVVLARDAVAATMVPESVAALLRQRLRSARAFLRESASLLATLRPTRACWWLTLLAVLSRATLLSAALYALTLPVRLAAGRRDPDS